jgi:hypothetical protein
MQKWKDMWQMYETRKTRLKIEERVELKLGQLGHMAPVGNGNNMEILLNRIIHGFRRKCLRAGFLTPVEGKRGRWGG